MVTPWVRIQWISDQKGYGLVADRLIPKGTITFVQDGLDIVISRESYSGLDPKLVHFVEKYSYEDYLGNRIISWDLGKYMNHDDKANTLTTGYGFEIAIRDIQAGEEVTDDYRIFSTHHDTRFLENTPLSEIKPWPQELLAYWDKEVADALESLEQVQQPLIDLITETTLADLKLFKQDQKNYKSVSLSLPLKYKLMTEAIFADITSKEQ